MTLSDCSLSSRLMPSRRSGAPRRGSAPGSVAPALAEFRPTISVAMCTFNGARFVREQLESIARQTLAPAEVVVSDDGSSDGTVDVLRECAATLPFPLRLEINPSRKGFVENFLDTMQRCEGELIALADQDDVWAPDKLAVAANAFRDPAVTACVHEVEWVDDVLQPLAARRRVRTGVVRRAAIASPWFVAEGSRLVFRRRVIEVLAREPRPLALDTDAVDHPQVHDEWVGFAARSVGELVYLPVVLGLWRRHETAYGFGRGAERPASRATAFDPPPLATQQHRARVVQSRIDYLEVALGFGADLTADERAFIAHEIGKYRALLPKMRNRQSLYERRTIGSRVSALTIGAARGVYAPQRRGGHGWLSFVQDVRACGEARS
jgi:glycosyltransferase involved in cell wall biosynthesis